MEFYSMTGLFTELSLGATCGSLHEDEASIRFGDGEDQPRVPPLRCAPVGMTIHILGKGASTQKIVIPINVTNARPERSLAEG
jgi:hypothetical protein